MEHNPYPRPMSTGLEVVHDDSRAPEVYHHRSAAPPASASTVLNNTPLYQDHVQPRPKGDYSTEKAPGYGGHEKSPPVPVGAVEPVQRNGRTIFGFGRATFIWAAIALALAVGLAVGVGVGVTSAQHKTCAASVTTSAPTANGAAAACSSVTTTSSTSATATSASAAVQTSPVSSCPSINDQIWTSNLTTFRYQQLCDYALDVSVERDNLAGFVAWTMDECLASCDAYNKWQSSSSMNVVVWSWSGRGQGGPQTAGDCWCLTASDGYSMVKFSGQDSALMVGTFNSTSIPS